MFTFANVITIIHRIKSVGLNKLLPSHCLLCGLVNPSWQFNRYICLPCRNDLPILPEHCQRCAAFLPANSANCGECIKQTPPFDRCYALFPYQSPIDQLIIKLKFNAQLHFANLFAELLIRQIKTDWYANQSLPDLIIPIPLHPTRLKQRGFNQAIEIAKPIAQKLGIPLVRDGILRRKMTRTQKGLNAKAREENMAHAFIHRRSYANLHIAILDDVVTTGQTVAACSEALRAAKARRIDIWCCARRS